MQHNWYTNILKVKNNTMTYNLICVHHGNAYSANYVLNLWKSANQYSTKDFNFYVFTDNIKQHPQDLGWNFIKLPDYSNIARFTPWWYKLEIFNDLNGIYGNNLYMDLDVIVVNNIDEFWDWNSAEFRICHDFNRAFNKNVNLTNSSVMAWKDSSLDWLYKKFTGNMQGIVNKYRGDQDLIHAELKDNLVWWPTEWAMSWKWELKCGGLTKPHGDYRNKSGYNIPVSTKIIVCHGKPNPHEIDELSLLWHK